MHSSASSSADVRGLHRHSVSLKSPMITWQSYILKQELAAYWHLEGVYVCVSPTHRQCSTLSVILNFRSMYSSAQCLVRDENILERDIVKVASATTSPPKTNTSEVNLNTTTWWSASSGCHTDPVYHSWAQLFLL